MPKRTVNVSGKRRLSCNNYSDYEYSLSDSENDPSYEPNRKKICSMLLQRVEKGSKATLNEVGEHTYCSTPIFSKVPNKFNTLNNCSSDSDSENENITLRRISERSTSSESLKCTSSKRKPKCFSKNAVMARMNRQRKKEYVSSLENDVRSLKESNRELKSKVNEKTEVIDTLKSEIKYLRSVLSNSKEIGVLLKRICNNNEDDLKITSSVLNTPSTSPDSKSVNYPNIFDEGTENILSDTLTNYDLLGINSELSNDSYKLYDFDLACENNAYFDQSFNVSGNDASYSGSADFNDFSCFKYPDINDTNWLIDQPLVDDVSSVLDDEPLKLDLLPFNELEVKQSYGVCLHVANKKVSLEFCAACNHSANSVVDESESSVESLK